MKKTFTPNRKFRRKYDRVFRKDPMAANIFLLVCEISNEKGQVKISPEELAALLVTRFEDLGEYALQGRPKK